MQYNDKMRSAIEMQKLLSMVPDTVQKIITELSESQLPMSPYQLKNTLKLSYTGVARTCKDLSKKKFLDAKPSPGERGATKINYSLTHYGVSLSISLIYAKETVNSRILKYSDEIVILNKIFKIILNHSDKSIFFTILKEIYEKLNECNIFNDDAMVSSLTSVIPEQCLNSIMLGDPIINPDFNLETQEHDIRFAIPVTFVKIIEELNQYVDWSYFPNPLEKAEMIFDKKETLITHDFIKAVRIIYDAYVLNQPDGMHLENILENRIFEHLFQIRLLLSSMPQQNAKADIQILMEKLKELEIAL